MSQNKRFHFYVKDKDGNIEMEICYCGGIFTAHYPRYEFQPTRLRDKTCFAEMLGYQVGMLIFAYSESEFKRFEKEFEEFMRNGKITNNG